MGDWDKVLGIAQAMSKRGAPPVSASWAEAQQLASTMSKRGAPPVSASWEEAQQLASTMSKRGGDEEIDWDKVLGIAQAVSKRTSKAFEDYVKAGRMKHDSTHFTGI